MAEKKQDFTQLSSRFRELFAHKDLAILWQVYLLGQKWPDLVGKDVAKKSEPAYIQNDILWIYVESSVLMQHMQTQKLQLLRKTNDVISGAEIKDIRWAMRPAHQMINSNTMHTEGPKKRKPDPEEKKAFDALASTVEDEQCRDALKKLWDVYNSG